MYSYSHACKIRDLGVDEDECKTHCERDGQSGCSPDVNGFQFELCGVCTRDSCTEWPTTSECVVGCSAYGRKSELDKCLDLCKEDVCNDGLDFVKGCNQMYSCSHACKIRELGVTKDECKRHCNRDGQSGCSPSVMGWEFE